MDNIQKFQDLLKNKLFQSEASDLDFGIYRILNYKRDKIEQFISRDLVDKIEESFDKHKEENAEKIKEEFEKVKMELIEASRKIAQEPFTPTGELKEEYKTSPLGKKYIELKERKETSDKIDQIKLQVFNDLYNFFSRYYEEGDFVPLYRYSIKGHKYAIPYNGEEIKLYWANADQYYVKTGFLFRDYTFVARDYKDYKVIFRIVAAKEELGSNKATKERFFVLDDEKPLTIEEKRLIIRFQYRELTEKEVKHYEVEGGSNISKQEKINQKTYDEILKEIKDVALKGYLGQPKNDRPLLLYQLNRFTAKNTKDYFIHKSLKRFLSEQLDYFIKAEVLDIETLERERFLDKHITRAKVVRKIGETIIDFLSQIEEFQKRLWEKKKFVLKTEYVITTDRVPEEFYDEILKNENQRKEWEGSGFEIPRNKEELKIKKLPVDTKYFSQEFKERLLEKLTQKADLDELLDGLLIKSENWQALNTILEKYKEKIQTIYIDPPFNKEQDADYLYNVKYKDSTWASMLENRLRLARDLLNERGSIFVRCDYNGNWIVRPLMNEIFGNGLFCNEITVGKTSGKKKTGLSLSYTKDYLLFFGKTLNNIIKELWKDTEEYLFYNEIINILTREKITGIENIKKAVEESIFWVDLDHRPGERKENKSRFLLGVEFDPPRGRHWIKTQERLYELQNSGKARIKCKNCGSIFYTDREVNKQCCQNKKWVIQIFLDQDSVGDNWTDISGYSQTWDFKTENSEILLKRVIESTSNEGDFVVDFFLGSGTTTAVAHKLKRKWIGVEMGEHFWTVVLPRMKKVLAYDKSAISKDKDVKEKYNEKTAGGFFKYQILEQYEDTLDNIELKENQKAQDLFKNEYLLKYFVVFETKESPFLLNIDCLKNPFSYKLRVNLEEVGEPKEEVVHIPETFNYLLGIKIKKLQKREKGGKYLFILGEKQGKDIAIVWREYSEEWNEEKFKEDKDFIRQEIKDWKPQVLYINGQSILTPDFGEYQVEIRQIEPEFKRLMVG